MTIKYQVKFTLYHYNSGDGRNGSYAHDATFTNADEAFAFEQKLRDMLAKNKSTSEFAQQYCWDGYLTQVWGVYEIVERKIWKKEVRNG